jgi:hypothetical protein
MDTGLTVMFLTLGVLGGMHYLLLSKRVMRVDEEQPFHVAAYQRDRRKARFYFLSVWVGLAAAFLSFMTLDALAGISSGSMFGRDESVLAPHWITNILRGVGLWGLMTIALVWTQVGQRVAQPGSDGKSLQTLPDEKQ